MIDPKPEILIAEDDDYWFDHYRVALKSTAVDLQKAKSVREASSALRHNQFASVIVDLEIPGVKEPTLGGFEIISTTRAQNAYSEILVITGKKEQDILDRVGRLGVRSIVKEVNHRELVISAQSMISGWKSRFVSIRHLLSSFPTLLPILSERGHGKKSVEVLDEYDVQDLLRYQIAPFFPDVIDEEYTVKRAGRTKRLDLVLKGLETVIETKMVRTKAHGKEISDELDVDIRGYISHPSCRRLFCFVYDPKRLIRDPRTVERDLSGDHSQDGKSMEVEVLIRPS